MQKSESTAETCAMGVLDQGDDETLGEVDCRLMFNESSVDNDTFGGDSYHSLPGIGERFSGVTVGGDTSLRTSTFPDSTTRGVPRNISSGSIPSDFDEISDTFQRYTRRGVGGSGGGMFGKGSVDGVNVTQDGENNLETSLSPDRRVLQRNVSSNSIRSDVGTSDRLEQYARRVVGGGLFGNSVNAVSGTQMGKLRPSNTTSKENTGNGTFLSNSVSMPHSLDAYFNLYAHDLNEDEPSSSHAQDGNLLPRNASQESINISYSGGSSKMSSHPRAPSRQLRTNSIRVDPKISQTLSDTDLLQSFANLDIDVGKQHAKGGKDTVSQGGYSRQPPSVECVVGYEIDTPIQSPAGTPLIAPGQPVTDDSPTQFHVPVQQQQQQAQHNQQEQQPYQQHQLYPQHPHHQYQQQYAFNQQYHRNIHIALGENGSLQSLDPMIHSLGETELLPGLPPHLANDSVALYNALLVQQSMSMAAMNQRRFPTYMTPENNYMAARSTTAMALAQAQLPQAAISNAFQPQLEETKTAPIAYEPINRNGYYYSPPPAMNLRGGSMVRNAGEHAGVSNDIHNHQGVAPRYLTATYVYKVRFKNSFKKYFLGPRAEDDITSGDYVKVEADRGEDLGVVFSILPNVQGIASSGMKRECVIRRATKEEIASLKDKLADEANVLELCRVQARQRLLPMKIIEAEYQFDRNKLTFFFKAEGRVDFRELVRDLFAIYKTRIWMQQVDEQRQATYSLPSVDMNGTTDGWQQLQQF